MLIYIVLLPPHMASWVTRYRCVVSVLSIHFLFWRYSSLMDSILFESSLERSQNTSMENSEDESWLEARKITKSDKIEEQRLQIIQNYFFVIDTNPRLKAAFIYSVSLKTLV